MLNAGQELVTVHLILLGLAFCLQLYSNLIAKPGHISGLSHPVSKKVPKIWTLSFNRSYTAKKMLFNALLVALALCHTCLSTSVISTFTDTNCQKSFTALTGPNGYPDGFCTDLRRNGIYGSFQIISLDPGCAGAQQSPHRPKVKH